MAGHPVTITMPASLATHSKVREDRADLEVLYLNQEDEWMLLGRAIENDQVSFPLAEDISDGEHVFHKYYMYYGFLEADKIFPSEELLPGEILPTFGGVNPLAYWPVRIPYDNSQITYTRPGEHWIEGASSTRSARAVFPFFGTRVRIISNAGLDKGRFEVRLDEGDWEIVDLFESVSEAREVYAATDLEPGRHEVQVRVLAESNEKALDNEINILRFEYSKSIIATDLGEEADESLDWGSSVGGV
jgi:hypothetical protein